LRDSFKVERRAAELNTPIQAAGGKFWQKLQRQLPSLAIAVLFRLAQYFWRKELLNAEQLKFYGVTTDFRCAIDEIETAPEVAGMIARHLGNEGRHWPTSI
jgi:hypothetical protein